MKICIQPIKSKEQSKEVQEKAFDLSFGWQGKYKKIRYYDVVSLYLDTRDNCITYSFNNENTISSGIILTPEQFLNADIDKSDWEKWTIVEIIEPVKSRWELLDIR